MRIQTDQEFKKINKKFEKSNSEFNVTMFSTKVRGGKAFTAK